MIHLHVHTDRSYLDGLGTPEEYAKRAKELGQPAIAITDHGSTSGMYSFQKACDKEGVKPILGSEFYIDHEWGESLGHLVVLAKDNVGLKNIFKLQEEAFVDNFYYKPRITVDMLGKYSKGLIVTTACLANQISKAILADDLELAEKMIWEYHRIFGEDFYLELQDNSVKEQVPVNEQLIKFSEKLGIELIVTNDVHYPFKEDGELKHYKRGDVEFMYSPHEVLLASQVGKTLLDEKRMTFTTQDFWLKSREEVEEGMKNYPKDIIQRALDNTHVIADKCNARLERGNYLPHFHTIPDSKSEEDLLREKVTQRYKKRIIDKKQHNKDFQKDVAHELDVICDEGYAGYFLIVDDYVQGARDRGVYVGPGRGSGSASKVAYTLGITQINPQDYNLLFERFLAHGRTPDFDVDFSDIDEVFEYLVDMYGQESVGRIMSFSAMKPKACVETVFRAFGHQPSESAKVKGFMPTRPSFTLEEAYNESSDLRNAKKRYPEEFEVIERLENVISHTSQHAGGIIIWDKLSDVLPIETRGDDRSKRIVALDMDELEELGHFKFDVLGLQTLEVINRALNNINKDEVLLDLEHIPLDDERVYRGLQEGRVDGVFQLEDQMDAVVEQRPTTFEDIIAINALIRPGIGDWNLYLKRRRGQDYTLEKDREYYMSETEGILTYQEQYLLDCYTFAGWDIAFADKNVRKNKDIRNDGELREKFLSDGRERGYSDDTLTSVWLEIEDAVDGGYGFNKAHSGSYGTLSYQTAYISTYYPVEFFASLMTQYGGEQTKLADYISKAKDRGIEILPPDINIGESEFEVVDGKIRYMLSSIKNIGAKAFNAIVKLRPIKGLDDLLERREARQINKTVVENLIKAGIFDYEDTNRIRLMNKFYEQSGVKEQYLPETMWNEEVKLSMEYDAFGMYLSSHPIDRYNYPPLSSFKESRTAKIGGEVINVSAIHDKNGNPMAFVDISHSHGVTTLLVFSHVWNNKSKDVQGILRVGNLVEVIGRRSGDKLLVNEVEQLF